MQSIDWQTMRARSYWYDYYLTQLMYPGPDATPEQAARAERIRTFKATNEDLEPLRPWSALLHADL